FGVPCGVVLGVLVAGSRLDPLSALAAEIALIVLIGLAVTPLAMSLTAVEGAIETLGPEAPAEIEAAMARRLRRLSPMPNALWHSVVRLRRAWRDRANEAEAGLAAAWAVFAAVPDPLILIDRQRRIVRANMAAAEFVGQVPEGRD